MMKLTRARAQDKSIGGTTLGHRWRYNSDKGAMDVPENVGLSLLATGDWKDVSPPKQDKKATSKSHTDTTADGVMVVEADVPVVSSRNYTDVPKDWLPIDKDG